ncbi:MAG: alkaline phosphatase D family protein [Candidatus Kapaibacterium sp.]
MKIFSSLLLTLILGAATLSAQPLHRQPLVGAVTDSKATIAAWGTIGGDLKLQYGTDETFNSNVQTMTQTATQQNDLVAKFFLANLSPDTRYYYRVMSTTDQVLSKPASFKTFPAEGKDAPLTVFFGSCQQGTTGDIGKTFKQAAQMGGDLFIQLGDWGYPDALIPGYPGTPGTIRQSYELRLDTTYPFARDILSQMPLAYVWDDHDFGGNNSSGALPETLRKELILNYDQHIPHYDLPSSEGLWHSFTMGNVEFFMIDDRSQRNPVDSAFPGGKFKPPVGHSMLAGYPVSGVDQRTWLLNAIRTSTARWKVLVSQVFFNPATSVGITLALIGGRTDVAKEFADKWVGYPADVDSMKALFQSGYKKNFLIISGDAHTNLYDNGDHSIVPEFMAGALDKQNSNLNDVLKSYGLNIWTASQTGSSSAVGRIRVETTPRHKMIIESFDTNGVKLLGYEMVDASSSAPATAEGAWRIVGTGSTERGLRLDMINAPEGEGTIAVFDILGRKIIGAPITLNRQSRMTVTLPPTLANGAYIAQITAAGTTATIRFDLAR